MAAEEQVCPNWYPPHSHKSMLAQVFTTHQAHCMKNFYKCVCGELIKNSEKTQHEDSLHSRKTCSDCGLRDLAYILKNHDCPRKPRKCSFCEAEFGIDVFESHAGMCGSRTTPCDRCGKFVVLKDLKKHVDSNCGQLEEAKSPLKSESAPKAPGKSMERTREYHHYTVAVRVIRPVRTHPDQLVQATSMPLPSSPPRSPPWQVGYS